MLLLLILCFVSPTHGGKRPAPPAPSLYNLHWRTTTASSSSSTKLPQDPGEVTASVPLLKDVLKDVYLSNKLSSKDVSALANAAYNEGAESVKSFARAGNWGQLPKNFARDMQRMLAKGISCPSVFNWPVPTWDPKARKQVMSVLPFLLPHEMVHAMVSNDPSLVCIDPLDFFSIYNIFEDICENCGLDSACTTAIGLHGDGVPFTKKDSMEILSWNFLSRPTADRIPFACISKQFVC